MGCVIIRSYCSVIAVQTCVTDMSCKHNYKEKFITTGNNTSSKIKILFEDNNWLTNINWQRNVVLKTRVLILYVLRRLSSLSFWKKQLPRLMIFWYKTETVKCYPNRRSRILQSVCSIFLRSTTPFCITSRKTVLSHIKFVKTKITSKVTPLSFKT
jgi:hypothetical protein